MAAPFERFTDRCHQVMTIAQAEARRRRHDYVGTEHLLLALVKHGEGVAACMLRNRLGDLVWVRADVERVMVSGSAPPQGPSRLPLSPAAHRAVHLAMDEAVGMDVQTIGTEHLLLGLARDGNGVAAAVLRRLGLRYGELRSAVIRVLETGVDPVAPPADPV
jgi:ATP-dependent Clp protease ATP-binding subunit ClpC